MRTYRRDTAVVGRRIGEETVLVPVRQNVADLESIYTLNAVGAAVWERIEAAQTLQSLALAISMEFDVTLIQAIGDIETFLMEMKRLQLVKEEYDAA